MSTSGSLAPFAASDRGSGLVDDVDGGFFVGDVEGGVLGHGGAPLQVRTQLSDRIASPRQPSIPAWVAISACRAHPGVAGPLPAAGHPVRATRCNLPSLHDSGLRRHQRREPDPEIGRDLVARTASGLGEPNRLCTELKRELFLRFCYKRSPPSRKEISISAR